MKEQLYRRYDVDEDTPVQFVGVYTTHWRGEWGEPEVMFAGVNDPLINNASRLLDRLEHSVERFRAAANTCHEAGMADAFVGWLRGCAEDAHAVVVAARGEKR